MNNTLSEEFKTDLMKIMVENLPVFRAKLGATQESFAKRVGLTKTTLNHIENNKKKMTWTNFIVILLLLLQNEETKPLVDAFGLYPTKLAEFLMFKNKIMEELE